MKFMIYGAGEVVDGENSVVAGTSWRPRIAEAVFIRGRTVQCRGENLEQLAVAAATSGRAGPTWTRATESIRFLARSTIV